MVSARRIVAAACVAAFAAPAAAQDAPGGLLPVPAMQIERGAVVTASMLTEKHFYYDPKRPLAVMTDAAGAIGKEARRSLPAGKPIPLNAFREARLVTRGKATEARFVTGALSISATVLPLADAGLGELVQFKNLDSGRTMTGIVTAAGSIEVSAP